MVLKSLLEFLVISVRKIPRSRGQNYFGACHTCCQVAFPKHVPFSPFSAWAKSLVILQGQHTLAGGGALIHPKPPGSPDNGPLVLPTPSPLPTLVSIPGSRLCCVRGLCSDLSCCLALQATSQSRTLKSWRVSELSVLQIWQSKVRGGCVQGAKSCVSFGRTASLESLAKDRDSDKPEENRAQTWKESRDAKRCLEGVVEDTWEDCSDRVWEG